jgi:hypothetical protein
VVWVIFEGDGFDPLEDEVVDGGVLVEHGLGGGVLAKLVLGGRPAVVVESAFGG